MDVDFIYDSNTGTHSVEIEGDQSVIARCLNGEFPGLREDSSELFSFVQQLREPTASQIRLWEWTIELEPEEVRIVHNSLYLNEELILEPDMSSDGWQWQTECGRDDLLLVLENWLEFVRHG